MRQLWRNLRYSLRALRKNLGFTAIGILTLALGIGANVAIFTLINALLLRDLPVPHPERIVELSVERHGDKIPFSYPMFRELERGQRVFSSLIAWSGGIISNVEVNGVFARANVLAVTSNFYSELGVAPLRGRLLISDDVNPQAGATSQVAGIGRVLVNERVIALLSSFFAALALLHSGLSSNCQLSIDDSDPRRLPRAVGLLGRVAIALAWVYFRAFTANRDFSSPIPSGGFHAIIRLAQNFVARRRRTRSNVHGEFVGPGSQAIQFRSRGQGPSVPER